MRTLATLLGLVLCTLFISGCSSETKKVTTKSTETANKATFGMPSAASKSEGAQKGGAALGTDWGDAVAGVPSDAGSRSKEKSAGEAVAAARPREAMAEEPMAGGKHEQPLQPPETPKPEPQSGQLTAGSFDDNLTPQFFRRFVQSMMQNPHVGSLPKDFLGQRVLLSVRTADGKPVGNCRIKVAPAAGGASVELISRSNGSAVCLTSWDGIDARSDLVVTVSPPDGSPVVKETVRKGLDRWDITLPSATAGLPANLDLCICLDTTGSMTRELPFLISEVKTIAAAIHDKFPNVQIRYGLVVYKDREDEYVAKRFEFTTDVEEFRRNLSAQRAAGGGDIPEAVEEGFLEATKLQWRDKDTARVMFHIADAPPHDQDIDKTLRLADQLRKKGVVIYPVACKGYDDPCEFVMRGSALLSGGQFLFLTDDSGIGGKHDEPHIPYYKVERLEQLMIRMIACELAGKRIEPEPHRVLRVVGKPVN